MQGLTGKLLIGLIWTAAAIATPAQTITKFDAPGAGTGFGEGTQARGINTAGVIAGADTDGDGVHHGFGRLTNGRVITFNIPGAGTGTGQGTIATAINTAVNVTGFYGDSGTVFHGFVLVK